MAKSILLSEIMQQPKIIGAFLNKEKKQAEWICKEISGRFDYLLIAARGSSDNAARYAQYLFGIQNHLQVALATPSIYSIYNTPPILKGALVIGISQSGQSTDIVSVLQEARKQDRPTLAITNFPNSPLGQICDFVLPLHAGLEKAVAATKTYTASLAGLALLSAVMKRDSKSINHLFALPCEMQDTLSMQMDLLALIARYSYIDQCTVIGRGYNYSTAHEIALKIKELNQIITQPYSSADFRHGPIAVIHKGSPLIIVAPKDRISPDIIDLISTLQSKNAELILISDDHKLLSKSKLGFPITRNSPEWLSPLLAILPGQLFAMQLAIEKNLNPDSPTGLTKVTSTR